MSWIQKLCDTYDYAVTTKAVTDFSNPLPEVGFIKENAEIDVTLSGDGKFLDADIVPNERQQTVIPCTLFSGMARQNPVRPHPIFDKVKLLATPEQLGILQAWCGRADTPESVKTVYSYLKKQTLVDDLDKRLSEKKCRWDPNNYVRFSVIDGECIQSGLWIRDDVRNSWKKCFKELWLKKEPEQLCYVNGAELPAAKKHPNIAGNTLLISMIDENCVGHFEGDPQKAVSVSCEATIKAHNTWKWLVARQGVHIFDMTFVAWDTRGFELPDVIEDDPEEDNEDGLENADTNIPLGKSMANAVGGYWSRKLAEFNETQRKELSTVVVMAIDSATGKGRASIAYYQELDGKEYIENLMYWYNSCRWTIGRQEKDGKDSYKLRTPLPKEICDLLYGKGSKEGQKKLKKQLTRELLPCITLRRHIPRNLVDAAFHIAANPLSFKDRNNKWDKIAWRKAVGITCAMSRKHYFDKGDEHSMALDDNERDRSYLYGRLLAVADTIELAAQKQGEINRTTNAMRYMQRFQQRPADTWVTLRIKLEPYMDRLSTGQQGFYRRLLSEIESLFLPEEMALAQPLNVRFLEGYSNQKTSRFQKTHTGVGCSGDTDTIINEEE